MNGTVLIPARGGSQRIPRKNLRPFLGTPAVARVIGTVFASGIAERIVVSTDDAEIAALAHVAGAEVPALRPAGLADHHTPTIGVVRHAIGAWLAPVDDGRPLWVVYPTALLVAPEMLVAAAERFRSAGTDFLLSVLRYPHPVERRLVMDDRGVVRSADPARIGMRTQDLAPTFHDAGQFYVGTIAAWRTSSPLESGSALGFELPGHAVVDIDQPEDWTRAEVLAQVLDVPAPGPSDRPEVKSRGQGSLGR